MLNDEELFSVNGGAGFSAAMITAVTKAFSYITDLGRYIGSAVNYMATKKHC